MVVKEHEKQGLVACMTSIRLMGMTDKARELSNYFVERHPKYNMGIDDFEGEDTLYSLNEYIEDNNLDMHQLDYPMISGTEVSLVPITENLSLKVLVADEYYGDGDYEKYVLIEHFLINENTTKEDVDKLIKMLKEYGIK